VVGVSETVAVSRDDFEALVERVDQLEEENEQLHDRVDEVEDENEHLRERVEDREQENEQLRDHVETLEDDLEEEHQRNHRVRASVAKLINTIREYEDPEEATDANDPAMVVEAANAADELYDTVERARQNAGLLDFREKRPETASITEKYLKVLGRAEEKADEEECNTVYLNYREVATRYGCAYKTDGYRVMEEMADRVPGVHYSDGRDLPIDTGVTHKIEQIALRVEWQHPDLRGWVRAHRSEEVE
jgi:chromosome segregation ATPase